MGKKVSWVISIMNDTLPINSPKHSSSLNLIWMLSYLDTYLSKCTSGEFSYTYPIQLGETDDQSQIMIYYRESGLLVDSLKMIITITPIQIVFSSMQYTGLINTPWEKTVINIDKSCMESSILIMAQGINKVLSSLEDSIGWELRKTKINT
mgnify:CR=1 FL=1